MASADGASLIAVEPFVDLLVCPDAALLSLGS